MSAFGRSRRERVKAYMHVSQVGVLAGCKGPVIWATFFFNFQRNIVLRCKLRSVIAHITTHLKHCHATQFCCCKLNKFVEKSRCQFKFLQHAKLQLATTKFCCMTMLEMGGNTCNNAFQLATQQCCIAS